jgi:hypothetical protein
MTINISSYGEASLSSLLLQVNQGLTWFLENGGESIQYARRVSAYLHLASQNPLCSSDQQIRALYNQAKINFEVFLRRCPNSILNTPTSESSSFSPSSSASYSSKRSILHAKRAVSDSSPSSSTMSSSSTQSMSSSNAGSDGIESIDTKSSDVVSSQSSSTPFNEHSSSSLSFSSAIEKRSEEIRRDTSCGQRFWSVISNVGAKIGVTNGVAAAATVAIGGFFSVAAAAAFVGIYALGRKAIG